VLILIEFDLRPIADGKFTSAHAKSGIPGWCAVAEEVQRAFTMRGVDTTVPERMGELVQNLGWYDHVFKQHADVPVGFWPKGMRFCLGLCILAEACHLGVRSHPSDRRPTGLDGV
jgi:hypothetical protein